MNTIVLQPDGELLDEKGRPISEPLRYLSFRIQLQAGATLRSFFRMISRHPVLAQISTFFPSFLEQYSRCPDTGCTASGYGHLEFGKTIEMIGYPGKPKLEIYHSLKGAIDGETEEIRSSQLDGLLDVPLTLGKLKHIVFGDKVDAFEFDTVFNFFEFIDGIAWELSFHGRPQACELRR
ncbi:MAG: hypothetical protein AMJ54_00270 [Deltaproteobacteria bacterium SG8_13]|nr:MAG: hypothetical protein AMJ54_00270 [Deltaproteobacteria bacterium SG8_13]